MRSEHHAAARMVTPAMPALTSARASGRAIRIPFDQKQEEEQLFVCRRSQSGEWRVKCAFAMVQTTILYGRPYRGAGGRTSAAKWRELCVANAPAHCLVWLC